MRKGFLLLMLMVLVSCGGSIDPVSMAVEDGDRDTISIPAECEKFYDPNAKEVVAVVEFLNRTTYADASSTAGRSSSSAAVGVGVAPTFAGAFAASSSNFETLTRQISPQLGEYAQNEVQSLLVSLGGVDVVARDKMEAILKEQQFQMTIADPDTAVEFGRLTGARYIITGSVDNINVVYKESTSMNHNSSSAALNIFTALAVAVYNYNAGWNVDTEVTVNLIDVQSGKLISTKKAKGVSNIGDTPMFSMDQVVSGAKKAMGASIKEANEMFIAEFPIRGYINEIRGFKQAALVSIGKDDGVSEGDVFRPYELSVVRDFRTGKSECQLLPINVDLLVSNNINPKASWAKIDSSNKDRVSKIKVGTIVKRVSK